MNHRHRFLALSLLAAACNGGDGDGPAVTVAADAALPDASPPPDAFVCTLTECGSACVDISSDPFHCGGCNMACDSPGQLCSGTLPCSCPEDFVTSPLGGGLSQVQQQAGVYFGVAPTSTTPLSVYTVLYNLSLSVDVDYDLSASTGAIPLPAAALGYDVNLSAFTARTAYAAFEGVLRFNELCATGVSGTLTGAVFTEVAGTQNPTPVEGGCQLSYELLEFSIGSCPSMGSADAGPVQDASI